MKKVLLLILVVILFVACFASCNMSSKLSRFIPDEKIISVEIQTMNYETGIEEISEKYSLTNDQSNKIKILLNEITYEKRYNLLKEKWTHVNDVKYIFTFEAQKLVLSENHIFIYDVNDNLIKHVEFNSSTAGVYFERINDILSD